MLGISCLFCFLWMRFSRCYICHQIHGFNTFWRWRKFGRENTIYLLSKMDVVKNFQIPETGTVTIAYTIGTLSSGAMHAKWFTLPQACFMIINMYIAPTSSNVISASCNSLFAVESPTTAMHISLKDYLSVSLEDAEHLTNIPRTSIVMFKNTSTWASNVQSAIVAYTKNICWNDTL